MERRLTPAGLRRLPCSDAAAAATGRQVGSRAGSPFVVIITFKDLQLDGHGGNQAPLSCDLNLPPSHFPPPPPSLSASLSSAPSSSLMNTERRIKYSWRRRARAKGGRGMGGALTHAHTHSYVHDWPASSAVCTLARVNRSAFGRRHRGNQVEGRVPIKV